MEIQDFLGASCEDVFQSELAATLGRRKEQHHGDRSYAMYPDGGVELSIDPGLNLVRTVFVYPESNKRKGYRGALPDSLSLGDSRGDLRAKLGPPDEVQDGIMTWDTWERGDYRLRAEYRKDRQRLKMLVLMG